jgi:hypothetical protein
MPILQQACGTYGSCHMQLSCATSCPKQAAVCTCEKRLVLLVLQVGRLELFTAEEHVNSVAPLQAGSLWAILHNLGKVRIRQCACQAGRVGWLVYLPVILTPAFMSHIIL